MRHGLIAGAVLAATLGACASSTSTSGEFPDVPDAGDAAHQIVDLFSTADQSVAPDLAHGLDLAVAPDLTTKPTGACDPSSTSLGAGAGPDTCPYGERCDAPTMLCAGPPDGTCAMASGAPTWDLAGKAAPVISAVSAVFLASTDSSTECASGDPAALVTVTFYTPNTLTTVDDTLAFAQQVHWKKSASSAGSWYGATFVRALPPKNAHEGSFQVGINCAGASSSTARTAGLYVTDEGARVSNTVCVTWP